MARRPPSASSCSTRLGSRDCREASPSRPSSLTSAGMDTGASAPRSAPRSCACGRRGLGRGRRSRLLQQPLQGCRARGNSSYHLLASPAQCGLPGPKSRPAARHAQQLLNLSPIQCAPRTLHLHPAPARPPTRPPACLSRPPARPPARLPFPPAHLDAGKVGRRIDHAALQLAPDNAPHPRLQLGNQQVSGERIAPRHLA